MSDVLPDPSTDDWTEAEHQVKSWLKGCSKATQTVLAQHERDALVQAVAFACMRARLGRYST